MSIVNSYVNFGLHKTKNGEFGLIQRFFKLATLWVDIAILKSDIKKRKLTNNCYI